MAVQRKGGERILNVLLEVLLTTVSSRPFKSCLVCSWRSCRNLPGNRSRINSQITIECIHCNGLCRKPERKTDKQNLVRW